MNCQEALNLLYDVIDKEASDIDTRQVEEHLRNCRDCSGVYRLERSVNELIQERLAHQKATPRLDSLKAKVLTELDHIDCANQPSRETQGKKLNRRAPQPVFRTGWAIGLAASLVVIIGAYYVGRTILGTHSIYVPLEQAHFAAEQYPDTYRSEATTSLARAVSRQSWAYDVPDHVNSFTLIGGQAETIDNIPAVHFIYHNSNRVVSVFVIDASLLTLPEDLLETLVRRNGVEFYDHNCRGCRLVYHRVGNALVVTATTHRDIDLLDFVPELGAV